MLLGNLLGLSMQVLRTLLFVLFLFKTTTNCVHVGYCWKASSISFYDQKNRDEDDCHILGAEVNIVGQNKSQKVCACMWKWGKRYRRGESARLISKLLGNIHYMS